MIKARLKSEFRETQPAENPYDPPVPTKEYADREKAFENFNRYIDEDPSLAAKVMGYLALGVTMQPEHEAIAKAGEEVLNKSNNGTQIGFEGDDWDRIWGIIFADQGHKETTAAYLSARRNKGEHSKAAQLLSRKRGAHTLRVYAEQRIKKKPAESPTPSLDQVA